MFGAPFRLYCCGLYPPEKIHQHLDPHYVYRILIRLSVGVKNMDWVDLGIKYQSDDFVNKIM